MSTATRIRSGAWIGGAPTAPAAGGQQSPPGISGWVLTYVQPMRQWFDELVGDPEGVDRVAGEWDRAETQLVAMADELQRVHKQLEPLEGRMIRVLDVRYQDLHPAARQCAEWSGAIAAAARYASTVVAAARNFILDSLYQIERLVGALFGFTLNPFDKVDQLLTLTDVVSEFLTIGSRFIQDMFDALVRLIELLNSLGPVISHLSMRLGEILSNMLPALGVVGGFTQGALRGAAFGPLGFWGGGLLGAVLGGYTGGAMRDAIHEIGDVRRYSNDDVDEMWEDYRDLLADPSVTKEEREAFKEKLDALEKAQGMTHLNSMEDFIVANGLVDTMGGQESSVFDIKLVRGEDGKEHWVVAFPSTKEWLDLHGAGGMNDGKNNLPLMFNPGLDSQYERAALQAMKEAGMAPGDPVVFTGFSQGGIAAAKFAASDGHEYSPIGVISNGSPVDHFSVPEHVPVISFTHPNDPVPWLDANPFGSNRPNFVNVHLPNPLKDPGYQPTGDFMEAHSSYAYDYSVRNDQHAQAVSEAYSWMGGEIIDHQIFEANQR